MGKAGKCACGQGREGAEQGSQGPFVLFRDVRERPL